VFHVLWKKIKEGKEESGWEKATEKCMSMIGLIRIYTDLWIKHAKRQ